MTLLLALNSIGGPQCAVLHGSAKAPTKRFFIPARPASEEDEQAFAEVVEYVRMAVLMVFASLTGQESALSQSGAGDTLH